MPSGDSSHNQPNRNARYEYRVWGKHRKATLKLADLATEEVRDDVEDCYLLVDDTQFNAKVRDSTLKIKHLVDHKRGFERWASNWHTEADSAPAPFDEVFDDLSLDRPQKGKRYDLVRAVEELDEDSRARAVFVTKRRRRYQIGAIRAEVARMDVEGSDLRLHSVAVQGDDPKELSALLEAVGLDGLPNIPVHVALEERLAS